MSTAVPRDTSDASSSTDEQCRPLSTSVRLCAVDIVAIVAIAFFIWYSVWGIPMTVRAFRTIHARRKARRKCLSDDLEKGAGVPDEIFNHRGSKANEDPFSRSSPRLQSFLIIRAKLAVPERTYDPNTADTVHIWQERVRLDSFRFPTWTSAQPRFLGSLSMSSVPALCSLQTEEDPVDPPSPTWSTFPSPPGLSSVSERLPSDHNILGQVDPLPPAPPSVYLSKLLEGKPRPLCKPCSR
ncbi:hypothetical protein C8Q79DRAFT_1008292 [Trametes meyenii]|nr:hypothetical protein C8Q79DRAFT_1008292 [Trametes meyenii]